MKEHKIVLPQSDARARRRQRWLNVILLGLLVPMVLAAAFRLSPMVGAPIRMIVKGAAISLPLLLVLLMLLRLRRR